ncbi:hypothetical protein M9Y10_035043 [Tritrichomonas musculus]|uniref:Surface antigen BspA-like n=1 Tax=Tritrichomonas musculus TaxID=1915356 RepID=A0ABR2KJT9_9EUKA
MSLVQVTIRSSVNIFGNEPFKGCLLQIEIPSSVSEIGDHCFEGCTALTNVYIPSSITFIGELIFIGCTSLTGVSIPSSYKKLFLSRYLGIDKKKVNLKKIINIIFLQINKC